MLHDAEVFLWDVAKAADDIQRYLRTMSYADYLTDDKTQAAVQKKFEIIGEALSQAQKLVPDLAARVTDLREVVAFRNQLIHNYGAIKPGLVWSIAQDYLPTLRSEIGKLIQELNAEPPPAPPAQT
jgi:uncharacterized protein with HEPN domain